MAQSLVDRVAARMAWLDRPADLLQRVVGGVYGGLGPVGRGLKNLAHGTRILGHPLHPAMSDVPLGAWTAAVVLDIVALTGHLSAAAGDVAVLVGLVGAVLAAVTGLTDYHETYGHERRVATMHGLVMVAAVIVYVVSAVLRLSATSHEAGVIAGFVGYVAVVTGGYLGGHLVFGMGTMVNRNAFIEGPGKFVDVGASADFPEGVVSTARAEEMPVLLFRRQGALHAISDVCSHAGGPLHEGALNGTCITCPWHGSEFDILDGSVRNGPATFAQPVLTVREQDGRVSVRVASEGH